MFFFFERASVLILCQVNAYCDNTDFDLLKVKYKVLSLVISYLLLLSSFFFKQIKVKHLFFYFKTLSKLFDEPEKNI